MTLLRVVRAICTISVMETTGTEKRFNGWCKRLDFNARPRVMVGCGKFHSVQRSVPSTWNMVVVACECGQKVGLKAVEGKVSSHECDDRCMSSTGFKCECKCGGLNHGKAA